MTKGATAEKREKPNATEIAEVLTEAVDGLVELHDANPEGFRSALASKDPAVRKAALGIVAHKKAEEKSKSQGVIGATWGAGWVGKGLVITSGVGTLFLSSVAIEGLCAAFGVSGPWKAFANWYSNG